MPSIKERLSIYEWTIGIAPIADADDTILRGRHKEFHCLSPKALKEWYADPFIVEKNGKTHVFMEIFDEANKKGRIGVSEVGEGGDLSEPHTIIEESWHMSFPYVFEYENDIYMLPECRHSGRLILYKSFRFPDRWERIAETEATDEYRETVDSILFETEAGLVICMSQRKGGASLMTKNVYGTFSFHGGKIDIDKKRFEFANAKIRYSYTGRNGGKPFFVNGHLYRISQESTETEYGVAVIQNEVTRIGDETAEKRVQKVNAGAIKDDLLYPCRKIGIHTYGRTDKYEVVDLRTARVTKLAERIILTMGRHVKKLLKS